MRQFAHVAVAVGFWLLLAFLWVDLAVDGQIGLRALRDTAIELAVISATVVAVTLGWVRHNVGIHNRKGPRRGRAQIAPPVDADRLGRPLHWAMPGGARAALWQQHLVIAVEAGGKTYRPGS